MQPINNSGDYANTWLSPKSLGTYVEFGIRAQGESKIFSEHKIWQQPHVHRNIVAAVSAHVYGWELRNCSCYQLHPQKIKTGTFWNFTHQTKEDLYSFQRHLWGLQVKIDNKVPPLFKGEVSKLGNLSDHISLYFGLIVQNLIFYKKSENMAQP